MRLTNDLTDADWAGIAVLLTEAGPDERQRFASALHESGHAVACCVLGGRVHKAVIDDGRPRTEYNSLPEDIKARTTYAGPWCEARGLARLGGRRVHNLHDMGQALPTTCVDWQALVAAGGPAAGLGVVPLMEQRCWPAVLAVAGTLFTTGQVGHAEVCAALGLSDQGGSGSFELACIRAGLRAVPGGIS
ncbi:hypothetical protein MSIMFI_04913 [Mycobacterium simulans]|uniref:hypothetical protein n=1 Tax=Mycobacterium simulans TaxID=627089 RepID=UPI00174B8C07|nr:hypothetical protein [Mycobacterium simulans]SON63383.1 hypothetical protein MSIMFI_04913 [Mycobacterium simulans]